MATIYKGAIFIYLVRFLCKRKRGQEYKIVDEVIVDDKSYPVNPVSNEGYNRIKFRLWYAFLLNI